MSRVGKAPVLVPKDVEVKMVSSEDIVIKGKLGELNYLIHKEVNVIFEKSDATDTNGSILVNAANDSKFSRAMWGTVRNIINNMVIGVSKGFNIRLEIKGVGYRAAADAKYLSLALGFSHEIKYAIPEGISIICEKPTLIVISGFNKQKVGQVAGEIIKYRPVEPFKGKGVYIEGAFIRRKEGKKK